VRSRLIASPAYLRARGVPRGIGDLAEHSLAALSRGGAIGKVSWILTAGEGRRARTETLAIDPVIVANDPGPLQAAAVEGLGIALVPEPYVVEDLRAGRVQVVLPEWRGPSLPVTAVFPSRRGMTPKLRVFLDFLVDTFAALSEELRGSLGTAPVPPANSPARRGA